VTPSFGVAPALIRIDAAVTPHTDNRAVEFVADSMEYYRSSRVEMDGSTAPSSLPVECPAVPAGEYDVRVALVGCHGTRAELVEHVLVMP